MKSKLLLLIAIFVSLGVIYFLSNNMIVDTMSKEQEKEREKICVKLIYDEPIDGYIVTADWQPFQAKDCETGYITINFHNTSTGKDFQYVNREKFSCYHIDLIANADTFEGYKDGDVYTIQYVSKPNPFIESPIDYYLPFQFYDIDFDGEKELLITDYYQGQQGNNYEVFEITDSGLEAKKYPPFNDVDNMMKFDSQNKIITFYTHSGAYFSCSMCFQKITTSTKQQIIIPNDFDEKLRQRLSELAPDAPSDFHIVAADIHMGDNEYKLKVHNGGWLLVK